MVNSWKEVSQRSLLDCRVFSVESSVAVSPVDAAEHEFFRLRASTWVQVLPITPQGQAVLVRQYRHGTGEITLEVPAGLVDPGELPIDAAVRECREETGYEIRNLEPLGVIRPNPALFDNELHAWYAPDAIRKAEISNTGTEQTEVVLVELEDLEQLLLDGTIDHALVAAVLWRFLCVYRRAGTSV